MYFSCLFYAYLFGFFKHIGLLNVYYYAFCFGNSAAKLQISFKMNRK